jgi:hypothetical protein
MPLTVARFLVGCFYSPTVRVDRKIALFTASGVFRNRRRSSAVDKTARRQRFFELRDQSPAALALNNRHAAPSEQRRTTLDGACPLLKPIFRQPWGRNGSQVTK